MKPTMTLLSLTPLRKIALWNLLIVKQVLQITPSNEPEFTLFLTQPTFQDRDYIQCGETIIIVKDGFWQKARLDSHAGKRSLKDGSLYWIISGIDEDWKRGCHLFLGESWGVLRGSDLDIDLGNITIVNTNLPMYQEEQSLEEGVV